MPVFDTAEQLYTVATGLFSQLEAEKPQAVAQLLHARLLVRLAVTNPLAEIWLNGRQRPLQLRFGYQRLHPDLEAHLEADTLDRILAGGLKVSEAVGMGLLAVKGQVWKAKALSDVFAEGQSVYPQVLRANGISR
jgi:hypothetical protein